MFYTHYNTTKSDIACHWYFILRSVCIRDAFLMTAHFHEVQTVYHNRIQLCLYAVKPCQSLRVITYQIDLAIPLLSAHVYTYLNIFFLAIPCGSVDKFDMLCVEGNSSQCIASLPPRKALAEQGAAFI